MTFSISSVTSKDGTTIGYRQLGHGPGLVLVGGGMQTAHHFDQLAEALADTFTRLRSGPPRSGLEPISAQGLWDRAGR
jgi:hypothetical protein